MVLSRGTQVLEVTLQLAGIPSSDILIERSQLLGGLLELAVMTWEL